MQRKSYRVDRPVNIEESVTRKLVKRRNGDNNTASMHNVFQKVSQGRAGVASDAKAIREILPDVKQVENLIIDSVLAPNDLTTIKPQFKLENSQYSDSPIIGEITGLIEDHFTNSHKIVHRLKSYLKDILFDYGSHTMVVLPENSIDRMINGEERPSVENMNEVRGALTTMLTSNIGTLGGGLDFTKSYSENNKRINSLGLEHYFSGIPKADAPSKCALGYSVHDNPNILRAPMLLSMARHTAIQERMRSAGIESMDIAGGFRSAFNGHVGYGGGSFLMNTMFNQKERAALNQAYRDRPLDNKEVDAVPAQSQLDRRSVGHPIVLEPTADAVIVAHLPDNPGEIIGAFLVLNENGNTISLSTDITRYNNLAGMYNSAESSGTGEGDASSSIQQAYTKMYGVKGADSTADLEALRTMYEQMVVDDLNQRLAEGVYGRTVELAAHENIIKVMMARHLSNMGTRLLWVPGSMMTYMAVDYNKDGTGRALTEDVRIVASYRSIIMMATVMGQVNSSVNHTKMRVEFDEEDAAPDETLKMALEEHMMTKGTMPFTSVSFLDQYTYLQAAGVSVETSGNPNYPDTKVELDYQQRQHAEPNSELNEMLRKMHLSAYGVTIEQLDQLLTSDTATAVKAATANFTKAVQNIRHIFSADMSDFIRKYVSNSTPLREEISEILKKHQKALPGELAEIAKDEKGDVDSIVNEIIRNLVFELPDAVFHINEAHIDAFESEMQLAEKIADVHFNMDILTDAGVGEKAAELAEQLKAGFIASWMRNWLRENGIDKFDSLLYGGEGDSTLDKSHLAYLETASTMIRNMVKGMTDLRIKNEKLLTEETNDLDSMGGGGGFGSDSGGSSDSGGGSDDFDLDFGDDLDTELSFEEEVTEETTTEAEEESTDEDGLDAP